MNEKFLSRGKREDNGEWVTGYYVKLPEHHIIFDLDGDVDYIIPETVGRCTGLIDKNGTLIFEGDIFKFKDEVWSSCYTSCGTEYCSWGVENYGVVGFDEEYARFDFVQYKFNENSVEADLHENSDIEFAEFVSNLEIIGNIHDNPEMLSRADMPVSNDVFQPVFQPTTPENFELMHG